MSYPCAQKPKGALTNYEVCESIGQGNLCSVHSVLHRGNTTMAMKVYDKKTLLRHKRTEEALMEKHCLNRLSSQNVILLHDTFSEGDHLYVITELCDSGELWTACRGKGLSERVSVSIFRQLIHAVQFVHRLGIVHRDLKAENIFMRRGIVKLGDLGSARDTLNPSVLPSSMKTMKREFEHFVGTPNFMAPEVLDNVCNDAVSDIWALGCTFYQILLGFPPFAASSDYYVFVRVKEFDLAFPNKGISVRSVNLIKSLVRKKRWQRARLDTILIHSFFASETSVDEQAMELSRKKWVASWKEKCKPGTGSAAIEHLNTDDA